MLVCCQFSPKSPYPNHGPEKQAGSKTVMLLWCSWEKTTLTAADARRWLARSRARAACEIRKQKPARPRKSPRFFRILHEKSLTIQDPWKGGTKRHTKETGVFGTLAGKRLISRHHGWKAAESLRLSASIKKNHCWMFVTLPFSLQDSDEIPFGPCYFVTPNPSTPQVVDSKLILAENVKSQSSGAAVFLCSTRPRGCNLPKAGSKTTCDFRV